MYFALRLIHVLLGVFWAGTIFFMAAFLLPTVRQVGPEGGKVMGHLVRSRFIVVLPTAAILTILSGLGLYWETGKLNAAWFATSQGMVLGTGATAAIVAFAIGMTIQRPSAIKSASLAAEIQAGGGPPTAEQAALMAVLQRRIWVSVRWMAALLALAVVCMATFRAV
jgi:hypothetical protein